VAAKLAALEEGLETGSLFAGYGRAQSQEMWRERLAKQVATTRADIRAEKEYISKVKATQKAKLEELNKELE